MEGHHVIHGTVAVADHGHKNIAAGRHLQPFEIDQHAIGIRVFSVKILIYNDQVIDMVAHSFKGVPRTFGNGDLIIH